MDMLPVVGAFIGGIGGGIFASKVIRAKMEKFEKDLQAIERRINKVEEEIVAVLNQNSHWALNWGKPIQHAIDALSAKVEALSKHKRN